ncbi:MAG: hypothetical protein J1E29_08100, partial [Duncaniella sp.]|nr:hypothetical protein [Duncaniella sp.]
MRLKTLVASVVFGGVVLAGCSDDIPMPDATEIYTREFNKEFGATEPNNPYNVASQTNVTV